MGFIKGPTVRWLAGLLCLAIAPVASVAEAVDLGTPSSSSAVTAATRPADAFPVNRIDSRKSGRSLATRHRDASGRPQFVNALIREKSPYLLDYAHSPIHWLPLGDEAASKAIKRESLKFISIGYSSCHWCHVMARESFDDIEIAAILNRGFVSIKIDSEERPDVDRRFLARLEALGVAPGWPMNFVLTPNDEVIWGATYLARDQLLATLERVESRWKTDRKGVQQLATAHEAQYRLNARPPATAVPAVADAYEQAVRRIAADFDPVEKGFGTGRKFPAPAELGVLRDAFLRSADPVFARMFVETLRAIASGGLHDPLDGGVFRYSIARSWNQPHFEKMLYDQAQVGRLMCQGLAISGDAALGKAASGIIDFALARFSTPSGLFAASFDSESAGIEGGYHQWSDDDQDHLPAPLQRLLAEHFASVMQSNGGFLLVPADPGSAPAPRELLTALREIRSTHPAPRRDDKAISAWNANMVASLSECALILGEPKYAIEAATRMRRLLATNAQGGLIRRYSLDGQAAREGTIEDLAWMLAALTALHDADGADRWTAAARRLLQRNLPPDREALEQALDIFARDRTGLSASAVLLRSLSRLARRSEEGSFAAARDRVAVALHKFAGAAGFASLTAALHDVDNPAPAPVAHAAQGRIRLSVAAGNSLDQATRFVVTADIRPGWHINSNRPTQDYLRPTRITVAGAGVGASEAAVSYPEGKPLRFGSAGDVLLVLDGVTRFGIKLPAETLASDFPLAKIEVALQTCSDRICLAPETLELAGLVGQATRAAREPGR